MPEKSKDKVTRKDRQDRRVERLTEKRTEEAKAAGVDLSTPGPMTTSRKAEIDAAINDGVKGEMLEGLKKIQSVRKAPEVDVPEKPKLELDIKDVRKERRAKIANVMYALGQGLSGEDVDPYKYTRPQKEERLKQYDQYKSASKAAKQKVEEFDAAYTNEQLEYLNSILNNPNSTEAQKNQAKLMLAKIDTERARGDKLRAETKEIGKGKDKTDKEEPTVRVVEKRGDKTYTQEKSTSQVQYDKDLEDADNKILNAQLRLEEFDSGWRENEKEKKERLNLEANLSAAQEEKQNIIDSFGDETTPATSTTTPKAKTKSLLDEAIEEYK